MSPSPAILTKAILQFTPEASRPQASYASRRARIQGTGVARL